MRYLCHLFLLLCLALTLAGCGGSGDDADDTDDGVRVEDEDAGSIVRLSSGETLVVELDGNPSTGYDWHVRGIDDTILRQDGEAEFEAEQDIPGSAGIVTLRFNAVGKGTTTLDLAYYREFEQGVPPADTFQIVVEVR